MTPVLSRSGEVATARESSKKTQGWLSLGLAVVLRYDACALECSLHQLADGLAIFQQIHGPAIVVGDQLGRVDAHVMVKSREHVLRGHRFALGPFAVG